MLVLPYCETEICDRKLRSYFPPVNVKLVERYTQSHYVNEGIS
jgi:hypothetical protein